MFGENFEGEMEMEKEIEREKESEGNSILPSDYVKVVAGTMRVALWVSERIERATGFRIHRTKRTKNGVVVFLDSGVDGGEVNEPN
jgi:hypothetical protein